MERLVSKTQKKSARITNLEKRVKVKQVIETINQKIEQKSQENIEAVKRSIDKYRNKEDEYA